MLELILIIDVLLMHTEPIFLLYNGLFWTYRHLGLSFKWFIVSMIMVGLFVDDNSFTVGLGDLIEVLFVGRVF